MKKEKTIIKSAENQSLIVISLKNESALGINPAESDFEFNIYPNPSNGKLNYSLNLETNSEIKINVYNINGQLVSSPISGNLSSGIHNSTIDLTDSFGNKINPGLYIMKVQIDDKLVVKKLIIE